MHDLVIKGAILVDGMGNPATKGEVAVSGGKIVAIGENVGEGQETVDAEGLTLAPGIIDLHTHFDAQLTWDPYATPSNRLGVTTVVIGNCGFTIAPCKPQDRERAVAWLSGLRRARLPAGASVWLDDFSLHRR